MLSSTNWDHVHISNLLCGALKSSTNTDNLLLEFSFAECLHVFRLRYVILCSSCCLTLKPSENFLEMRV